MLACFKIRAVPINVNYRYVKSELLYVLKNADLVGLIHGREFIPPILDVRDRARKLSTFVAVEDGSEEDLSAIGAIPYEDAVAAGSSDRDFGDRADDDLFILYTGGTTGMPKGVMWPHKAVFYAGMGGAGYYHPDGPIEKPEEIGERARTSHPLVSMPLAPLMHGACWWYACVGLLSGHKVVLNPKKSLKGEDVWGVVEKERVNALGIVGDAMAIPLLDALRKNPGRWGLGSIFNIGSGGAVFSEAFQQEFKHYFPNCFITNTFGSSETGSQGGDTGEGSDGLGSIVKGDHSDVITEDHRFVEPGSGEKGFLARSGHTPIGYYNDAEKTAKTFISIEGKRWALTGDLATVEADNRITVFGRGSNCINTGGEKVFPEEVEQAIKSHSSVLDALVVATPDPRFSERVTSVVQLRDGEALELGELQEHCRQHIAGYKIPRELHVVDKIERSASGKPDYKWAKTVAEGRC
jgi:acyl-CoA synthetase (AMP-forming)/AMP-acid ligase II